MTVEQMLPMGLAFIMLSIGLGLKLSDFTYVLRHPAAMGVGLVNQIVLLPLLGAGLVWLYDGRPEFAIGLMILAASPGGITSNLLTLLAGGNTALSISMTAVASLASVVTLPLILGISQMLLLDRVQEVTMPIGMIMGGVFAITGLPIALGMALARWKTKWADWLRPKARLLATITFALIVASAFVGQMDNILRYFTDIGPFVAALNGGTMVLGLLAARGLRLNGPDSIAICLESGLQNAALAIFVATTLLGEPMMVIPAIIYALVMNITAGLFLLKVRAEAVSQSV
ncbi:bile acid:sodium symporter family protein [Magnetospira thiophila]